MDVISQMRFGDESDLFGKEKDDSFRGSIGNIYINPLQGKNYIRALKKKQLIFYIS